MKARPDNDCAVKRRGAQAPRPSSTPSGWAPPWPELRSLDGYTVRMGSQCLEIIGIGGEHSSARFGERHNEGVYGRTATSEATEQGRAASDQRRNPFGDVAGLEEPVFAGVPAGVALKTFNKDHAGNRRWPQPLLAEGKNQSLRFLRTGSQAGHATGIEDQHGTLGSLATRTTGNSSREGGGVSALARRGLSYLSGKLSQVFFGGCVRFASSYLSANGILKELGSREPTTFHHRVEFVG